MNSYDSPKNELNTNKKIIEKMWLKTMKSKKQKFKFSELSKEAQKVAAQDYADEYNDSKSWSDFEDGDRLTLEDGFEGCTDCEDELFYDINGVQISDAEA